MPQKINPTRIGATDVRIALLGAGVVGKQVARLLLERAGDLSERVGAEIRLVGIGVRNTDPDRYPQIPQELLTSDFEALIAEADLVVEVMGGIEPARHLIKSALRSGAAVITANKKLLAAHGAELFAEAERSGSEIHYEAAVATAIPIVRPLNQSLSGDRVTRVLGIVNGTTNFILDRMDRFGESFDEALETATRAGYAETDPTDDVEGFDAANKAAIISRIAFHQNVDLAKVHREGILGVTQREVELARENGYVVKLLAICERVSSSDGSTSGVSARVHPTLIPRDHPLAAVRGAYNAVFVEAESAGDLMFYGAGAGGVETASAILGDLVSAARRHVVGGPGISLGVNDDSPMIPITDLYTRYQIGLDVEDHPGVLANIASTFARNSVSVETLVQQTLPRASEGDGPEAASLRIVTHLAPEHDLQSAVTALTNEAYVREVSSVIRME